jgi:hypothetical protein
MLKSFRETTEIFSNLSSKKFHHSKVFSEPVLSSTQTFESVYIRDSLPTEADLFIPSPFHRIAEKFDENHFQDESRWPKAWRDSPEKVRRRDILPLTLADDPINSRDQKKGNKDPTMEKIQQIEKNLRAARKWLEIQSVFFSIQSHIQ